MSEILRILVDDAEVDAYLARFEAVMAMMGTFPSAGLPVATAQLAAVTDDLDTVLTEAGGLDAILFDIEEAKVGIEDVAWGFEDLNVPGLNRSTRVLLMRVPILRDIIRMMGVIRRMQIAMKLGDVLGPITATMTAAYYAYFMIGQIQRWIERKEAHDEMMEKAMNIRLISIEEALRTQAAPHQAYRRDISP